MRMDKKTLGLSSEHFSRLVVISVIIFLLILVTAGNLIHMEKVTADFSHRDLAPDMSHPFGTDWLGRDMLLRVMKGLSFSLRLGAAASLASGILAVGMGTMAAIGPKWLDYFCNWLIDLVMGIPHMILLILISFACGRGMAGLLAGISLTHWPALARLIRSEILELRSQQYIQMSRRFGHSRRFILWHHILPHILPQFFVGMILLFPQAILHESALSFLGYGLSPEQPAVGTILSECIKYVSGGMWWLAVFPGITLAAMVLMFDWMADHLKILLRVKTDIRRA